MWKVGDVIEFVDEVGDCSCDLFTLGDTYKIIHRNDGMFLVKNDNGENWYIENDAFELVKRKLNSEEDFLDAFQENFKDGV